jgi:hypothetical protein
MRRLRRFAAAAFTLVLDAARVAREEVGRHASMRRVWTSTAVGPLDLGADEAPR